MALIWLRVLPFCRALDRLYRLARPPMIWPALTRLGMGWLAVMPLARRRPPLTTGKGWPCWMALMKPAMSLRVVVVCWAVRLVRAVGAIGCA